MKKLLIVFLGALFISGCASKSDLESTNSQIEDLKSGQIASISEQLSKLQASLTELQGLYDALPEKDEELNTRITELKTYVDEQLPLIKDWGEATFSTLEQYQETCDELHRIKTSIESLDQTLKELIDDKLSSLETSIKGWVNEKLTGYWTIAETQAKLDLLSKKDEENLEILRSELKTAKDELTSAYREEISKAIEESEGRLSSKIDKINQNLLDKISDIESRLDAIEKRLDELEKVFAIEFIEAEGLACMPGKSIKVEYRLINAKGECQIECIGENGWSGSVAQETDTAGYITITAPTTEVNGKVLVLAHCGNKMAMKALYFDAGILKVNEVYNVGWQGDEITVPIEYNLNYTVDFGDVSWLTFTKDPSTKAVTQTVNYILSVKENPEDSPARTAEIKFYNSLGQLIKSITVYQALSPTSSPISFADQYAKLVCLQKYDANGDGELSYFEAGKVTSLEADFFGDYKPAVTSFDELQYFVSLEEIPDNAFLNVARMKSAILSPSIKTIGKSAFEGCKDLNSISFSNALEIIGEAAFRFCSSLSNVSFPRSLRTIGIQAFRDCSSIDAIVLNEGLETIGGSAFDDCTSVERVYVPSSVRSVMSGFPGTTGKAEIHGTIPKGTINGGAYSDSSFSEIIIGDDVTSIGAYAFHHAHNTMKVTIGKNVESIGSSAFDFYSTKPEYFFRRFLPVNYCPTDYSKLYVPRGAKEIYMAAQGWPSSESVYDEYDVE